MPISLLSRGVGGAARTALATAQVAKQGELNAGSSSRGGGSCPKMSSHERSSKSGFMYSGTPISFRKKRCVGTLQMLTHCDLHPEASR